jgi:hypothetical protein
MKKLSEIGPRNQEDIIAALLCRCRSAGTDGCIDRAQTPSMVVGHQRTGHARAKTDLFERPPTLVEVPFQNIYKLYERQL